MGAGRRAAQYSTPEKDPKRFLRVVPPWARLMLWIIPIHRYFSAPRMPSPVLEARGILTSFCAPFWRPHVVHYRPRSPLFRKPIPPEHYVLFCADAMSPRHNTSSEPAQTIEGEHLDPQKLYQLLERVYGPEDQENAFRVEVGALSFPIFAASTDRSYLKIRLNRYKIYLPSGVNDALLSPVSSPLKLSACKGLSRQEANSN